MAGGAAFAGGMPSDEGPEIILDELGFNRSGGFDENAITALIKSQEVEIVLPAAIVEVIEVSQAPNLSPQLRVIPPVLYNPIEGLLR